MDISAGQCIAADVKLGKDVRIYKFVNLYGCEIGDRSKTGAFVEIQESSVTAKPHARQPWPKSGPRRRF